MMTGMQNRTFERVPAFTDAVVAIALTLLVLPLAEFARELGHMSPAHWFGEHWADLFAFALSFAVIGRYWRTHHQLFGYLQQIDRTGLSINIAWLFGLVFFPVPTAMIAAEPGLATGSTLAYLLTQLYISLAGLALTWWIGRRPALQHPGQTEAIAGHVRRSAAVCLVIVLTTALVVPFGRWALLGLLLVPVAQILATRFPGRSQVAAETV
jgi:uncharacterized membrane protein